MPYKNDDLDKLFRKAARNYPLKTDNADWDKLSEKLANSQKIAAKKNNRKYAVVFLLSVITISSLSVYTLQTNNNQVVKSKTTVHISTEMTPGQNKVQKAGSNTVFANSEPNSVMGKTIYSNKNSSLAENSKVFKDDAIINTHFENDIQQAAINAATGKNIQQIKSKQTNTNITNKPAENITTNEEEWENEDVNTVTEKITAQDKLTHVQLKPVKRIYGIAYGGPEFSIVKFQKATNPGYRMGVALGYKINDRFNIEVGLQREHLNFYSNGKYVDTSLLRIKRNTNVENLNASSKITSVPLTLRYNFLSNRNGHFFTTVGVNAVIITHSEHYDYDISRNGIESSLSKKYNAVRNPKYFSGINVSAGYQTKVKGSWSMKIEPYYQTPVNDFGVGRVPVSNFGVDIGIVKDLK